MGGRLLRRDKADEVVGADDDERQLGRPGERPVDLRGQVGTTGTGHREDPRLVRDAVACQVPGKSSPHGVGGPGRSLSVGEGVTENRESDYHSRSNNHGTAPASRRPGYTP